MKTELTKSEEDLIPIYRDKHIKLQTTQEKKTVINKIVNEIWTMCGWNKPKVILCNSPIACRERCQKEHGPKADDFATYWSIWFAGYLATYDFARAIGIELDDEKYDLFDRWTRSCPFILFNEEVVYVSRKPEEIHFNDEGQLHNEEGMSCRFKDGYGIYTISGVSVDKQVVMEPETQTVKQINDEDNEEVKRIRIERYGWQKYMEGIDAKVLDKNRDEVSDTNEFLFSGNGIVALLCICPSTGKEFVLEVPPETKTCAEAQDWVSGGLNSRVISAS